MKHIDELITKSISTVEIFRKLKTQEIHKIIKKTLHDMLDREDLKNEVTRRSTIMKMVNFNKKTITIYSNHHGSLSAHLVDGTVIQDRLYSSIGDTILFSLDDHSFPVTCLRVDGNNLTEERRVIVNCDNPIYINGKNEVFYIDEDEDIDPHVLFDINFPEQYSDIDVFDISSKQKVAWLPRDDMVTHYLVSIEALENVGDPSALEVYYNLIYHYHPAVRWEAFRRIYSNDTEAAKKYLPILKKGKEEKLKSLINKNFYSK